MTRVRPCTTGPGLGVRTTPYAVCKNQPTVLDNYGSCGGVGAHSRAIQRRLRAVGKPENIPFCVNDGSKVVDCQGKFICDPTALPRSVRNLGEIYTRPASCNN